MIQYFPIVTGSLTVLGNISVSGSITTSGSITISGSITSASFASTASYWSGSIVNAESASFASTASFVALAQSASNAVSAVTASFANNLTVAGTLTAQTLVVQTITSSVDFVTGSTRFGSILDNTHIFTGSVSMTGSLAVITNGTEFQVTSTGVKFGNVIGDTHTITGSVNVSGSSHSIIGTTTFIGNNASNTTENASVSWNDSNANLMGKIVGYRGANGNDGNLRFYVSNTPTLALTISGSGNIGIGTSTPTNGKLEVQTGATAAGLWVQTGGTTTGYIIADFRTGTNLSALKILGNGSCEFGGSLTVGKLFSNYNGSQFINTSSGLVNYIDLSTIMSNHDSAIISIGQGNDNKLAKATVIVQRTAYTSGVTYSVATLGTQPIAAYLSFAINGSYLQMQTTAANATYYYNALVIPAY